MRLRNPGCALFGLLFVFGSAFATASHAAPRGPIHLVERVDRSQHESTPVADGRGRVGDVSKPVLPQAPDVIVGPVDLGPGDVLRFHYAAEGRRQRPEDESVPGLRMQITAMGSGGIRTLFDRTLEAATPEWRAVEVPIEKLRGRFRLFFQTRSGKGEHPLLPLWGDPTIWPRGEGAAERPSVLLVSLDTLRARSLGIYGRERATSPRFDALTRQGTLFEAAFTTFSNTLPAHLGLFLGRFGWPLEMEMNFSVDPEVPMLGERFREAGYATAAFTENARLVGRAGFWRGFGTYYENKSIGSGLGAAADTFARALRWLESEPARPFFLFVHTYQVHAPYDPPSSHRQHFRDSRGLSANASEPTAEGGETSLPDAADSLLLYEQEIRYLDDLLADFLDALDERVPRERLIVVVTADHGEEFREHGQMLHGQLYDETLRVPLFVRWPGRVAAGRRIEQVVSLVDVAPTLLDLAELPPIADIDGRSLRPLLAPERGTFAERTILARSEKVDAESVAARSRHHKCIARRDGSALRCFDLRVDPGEEHPLGGEALAATHELQAELERFRRQVVSNERAFGRTLGERRLDAETRSKLEALGYVVEPDSGPE